RDRSLPSLGAGTSKLSKCLWTSDLLIGQNATMRAAACTALLLSFLFCTVLCFNRGARLQFVCAPSGHNIAFVQITKDFDQLSRGQSGLHIYPVCLPIMDSHHKGLFIGARY